MFRKILVANDGSEGARKALMAGIDLAKRYGAELHSISVEEHLPHYAATIGEVLEELSNKKEYFRKVNEEAKSLAQGEGIHLIPHIIPGHEVQSIVEFLRSHRMDLLVVGFIGHSKVFDRIWGSTSQRLAQLSPCAVLVVK